jgi:hypothetical protein
MFTYRLHKRNVVLVNKGSRFEFPNRARIEMRLEPRPPFGAGPGPSRTLKRGATARVFWNANLGYTHAESDEPIAPVDVQVHYKNVSLRFKGNEFSYEFECASFNQLANTLYALIAALPATMSAAFADMPCVAVTTGTVGDVPFEWHFSQSQGSFFATTTEEQEKRLVKTIERLVLLMGGKCNRLLAALHYFHVACRLMRAGHGPWEFMAETVLNLNKILEVLFYGPSIDKMRAALRKLGYPSEKVEAYFAPIMMLRNDFDVGHVSLALLQVDDLDALYRFLERCEDAYVELFEFLFDKLETNADLGILTRPAANDPQRGKKRQRFLERLRERQGGESRLATPPLG